jgi:hypothetical protein
MSKVFQNQQVLQRRISSLLRQHATLVFALSSFVTSNSPWTVHTSPEGKTYYYNATTKVSTFEKPPSMENEVDKDRLLSILNDTVKSIMIEIREYIQYVAKVRAQRMDEPAQFKPQQGADHKELVESEGQYYTSNAIRDMQTILTQWNNDLLNIVAGSSTYEKAKWIPLFATMFCKANVQKGSLVKKLDIVTDARKTEEQVQMACQEQLDFALRMYMQLVERNVRQVSSSSFLPPDEVFMAAHNLGQAFSTWATQMITDG